MLPIGAGPAGEVIYGIRPEHLEIVPADTPWAMSGKVTVVECTGTATFVAIQAGSLVLHALFSDRPALQRGDQIALRPKLGVSHLFEAKTEGRIG